MAKYQNLSEKSQTIVQKYVSAVKHSFSDVYRKLIASLYVLTSDAAEDVCDILRSNFILDLTQYLSQDEIDTLLGEFKTVVQYCYKNNTRSINTRMGEFVSDYPQGLLSLCTTLLEPEQGKTVFLPYAGMCTFAINNPELRYEGFEISTEEWAMYQIILGAYDVQADIKLDDMSSIEDGAFAGKEYDYMFSLPPIHRNNKKLIAEIIHILTDQLAYNAKACLILPEGFMYDTSWSLLRKHILTSGDYSITVVSLPQVFSPFTILRWCILYLKKDDGNNVMLMDATSEEFIAEGKEYRDKFIKINPQTIMEALTTQDKNYVWHGKATEVDSDYSLLCSCYLADNYAPTPKEGEQLMSLGQLITISDPGKKGKTNLMEETSDGSKASVYPTLGMTQLSNNYQNCDIVVSNLPNIRDKGRRYLSHDSLVVGFRGGKFKVGKIHMKRNDHSVCLDSFVFPISIISSSVITSDFLFRALMLEETLRQANMYATGVTIQSIKPERFLKIKIIVPSLERQADLCRKDAKAYLTEAERAIVEAYEEFRKDMHMKKHAIGQTIFNFNNWWKVLQKARKRGNGIVDDNATVGIAKPIKISEVYDNLENAVMKLQQQISKLDRGNGLQVERFALTTFIENYIQTHQSPLFTFEYDSAAHHVQNDDDNAHIIEGHVAKIGDPIEYVTFAPEALTIIFDNIVSNACSHGFAGRESGNVIRIEILPDGDKFVVTVANNGLPVNKQLTSSDVFTYGKTSQNGNNHYGIGGYEVSNLMHEFNGSAALDLTPENEFTVCYRLTFNDTNIA